MPAIPGFLLKGLYVKGSLRNTDDGFEFQIKNEIQDGYMIRAMPLKVDRKPVPMKDSSFVLEGVEVMSSDVSEDNPVLMPKGKAITAKVRGMTLRRGRHTLEIASEAKGFGEIRFSISDTVR
jgi:hypothetical protein